MVGVVDSHGGHCWIAIRVQISGDVVAVAQMYVANQFDLVVICVVRDAIFVIEFFDGRQKEVVHSSFLPTSTTFVI